MASRMLGTMPASSKARVSSAVLKPCLRLMSAMNSRTAGRWEIPGDGGSNTLGSSAAGFTAGSALLGAWRSAGAGVVGVFEEQLTKARQAPLSSNARIFLFMTFME